MPPPPHPAPSSGPGHRLRPPQVQRDPEQQVEREGHRQRRRHPSAGLASGTAIRIAVGAGDVRRCPPASSSAPCRPRPGPSPAPRPSRPAPAAAAGRARSRRGTAPPLFRSGRRSAAISPISSRNRHSAPLNRSTKSGDSGSRPLRPGDPADQDAAAEQHHALLAKTSGTSALAVELPSADFTPSARSAWRRSAPAPPSGRRAGPGGLPPRCRVRQHRRAHREGHDADRAVVRRQRSCVRAREAQAEEREDQQRISARGRSPATHRPTAWRSRARDLHPALETDRQQQVDRQGPRRRRAGAGRSGRARPPRRGRRRRNGIDHGFPSMNGRAGAEPGSTAPVLQGGCASARRILPQKTHREK